MYMSAKNSSYLGVCCTGFVVPGSATSSDERWPGGPPHGGTCVVHTVWLALGTREVVEVRAVSLRRRPALPSGPRLPNHAYMCIRALGRRSPAGGTRSKQPRAVGSNPASDAAAGCIAIRCQQCTHVSKQIID